MLSKNQLRYVLALQRVPNLGDASAKKLIQHVGSPEGVFKEKKKNLLKIEGIGAAKLKHLHDGHILDQASEEINFITTNDVSYVYYKDKNYPERLKYCFDGPILFFQRGNIDLQNKKIISVVGTRNVTSYGARFCEELIDALSPVNPVIISGFAYGVDIIGHKSAIKNGLQTVACLAHGFNHIYPKEHKRFCKGVEENGGFITEFWSSDGFDRNNFLKRNRIIAGLSEATVVIESAEKGGSLVTADIANSYNREVFAVPGRVNDLQSKGCNDLIKSNQARLLSSAGDIVYMMGWKLEDPPTKATQKQLFVELNTDEQVLFDYLKTRDKEVLDIIALACDMPTHKIVTLLLNMELKGVVRPLPGKLYQCI